MVNPYEELIKEYLELCEGYYVRLDTKYKKHGKKRWGWGDIDIIATHPNKKPIVGEAKSYTLDTRTLKKIIENFKREDFKNKLRELGITNFEKYIYCWSGVSLKVKKLAEKHGFKIKVYSEIIDNILQKVILPVRSEDRWFYDENRPLTVILQLMYEEKCPGN